MNDNGLAIAIRKAFARKRDKRYPFVYWAIDLHDTIIRSTYSSHEESKETYPHSLEVLRKLSESKVAILILWTSSYEEKMIPVMKWLRELGVSFTYFNENPECGNTTYGDFRRKFFYDVMLDDRAGFNPETDWLVVKNTLIELGEW